MLDLLAVADVGTVIHPRSLEGADAGRHHARDRPCHGQKWVYDQHYGVPLAKRFYHNRPPSILDAPLKWTCAHWAFRTPKRRSARAASAKRPSAPGCGAVLNAISAALGDEIFRRAPVTPDMILMALEHGRPMQEALTANI